MIKKTAQIVALAVVGALSACGGSTVGGPSGDPASLALADLPDGWVAVPNGAVEGGVSPCLDMLSAPGGPLDPANARTTRFAAGPDGPFLFASVLDRPAEQTLPEIDGIVVPCDATKGPAGHALNVQGAVIDGLPADSFAAEGRNSKDGALYRYTVVSAGTGKATAIVLLGAQSGEVDQALAAEALNTLHDRLPGN